MGCILQFTQKPFSPCPPYISKEVITKRQVKRQRLVCLRPHLCQPCSGETACLCRWRTAAVGSGWAGGCWTGSCASRRHLWFSPRLPPLPHSAFPAWQWCLSAERWRETSVGWKNSGHLNYVKVKTDILEYLLRSGLLEGRVRPSLKGWWWKLTDLVATATVTYSIHFLNT